MATGQLTSEKAIPSVEEFERDLRELPERWLPRAREVHGWAQRWLDAWNSRDLDALTELVTDDIVWDDPGMLSETVHGRTEFRAFGELFLRAFPDVRFDLTAASYFASEGSGLAVPWRITATFTGELALWGKRYGANPPAFAPTGRRFDIEGVDLYEFRDGLLSRWTTVYDAFDLNRQLGLSPAVDSRLTRLLLRGQRLVARLLRRRANGGPGGWGSAALALGLTLALGIPATASAALVLNAEGGLMPNKAGAPSKVWSKGSVVDDTGAKPPQAQKIVLRYPAGGDAKFDPTAASYCSLAKLEAVGRCPSSSVVGKGTGQADVRFGGFGILTANVIEYNLKPEAGEVGRYVNHAVQPDLGVTINMLGHVFKEPGGGWRDEETDIDQQIPQVLGVTASMVGWDITYGKIGKVRVEKKRAKGKRGRNARTVTVTRSVLWNPTDCDAAGTASSRVTFVDASVEVTFVDGQVIADTYPMSCRE